MKVTCGVFLYSTRTKSILVCHATNAAWNTWSIPKGLQEGESDLYRVAVRELLEETGIDIQTLHLLKVHQLPGVKYQKQNKVLESFLLVTSSDLADHKFSSNTVGGTTIPEIDKWKWVSLEDAGKWLHESQVKHLGIIAQLVADLHF